MFHHRDTEIQSPSSLSAVSGQLSAVSGQRSVARGFSLLELVIALTILSLMAGVIFSSLRLALNSYEKSQQRLEQRARERVLLDQIRRQIGSLFAVRPSGSFVDVEQSQAQGQQALFIATQSPLFSGAPDSVTFVTVAPLMLHENPGLTVVRYGLAQDERGNLYLGAMEARYMGLDSFMTLAGSPRGKPLPLVESVINIEFQYYGYDPEGQQYRWFESWEGEQMLSVPEAIRINYNEEHVTVAVNASFFGSQATQSFRQFLGR